MFPSEMVEPPPAMQAEEPKMSVSRRMAFAAWDALKGEEDPAAQDLPADTQNRLEHFAKQVRNLTIEQLAGAVNRFYMKQNAAANESLLSLKE